jgi:hypothetical protein
MKKSSHWYTKAGAACHEVAAAKGGMRKATLADARKLTLLPSVTTILDVLDKPQLTDWKLEQVSAEWQRRLANLTRTSLLTDPPRPLFEGVHDLASRDPDAMHADICERAFQQVEDAADAGTAIHKGIELALQGLAWNEDAPVMLPELKQEFPLHVFVRPVIAWCSEHGIQPTGHEVRIVSTEHGYAGTGDLPFTSRHGIGFGDWKTRKTKPGRAVKAYDTQKMQIAAYHGAHFATPDAGQFIAGFNLFVSTTEPGRIEATWYTAEELAAAFRSFVALCDVWRFLKGYDPR